MTAGGLAAWAVRSMMSFQEPSGRSLSQTTTGMIFRVRKSIASVQFRVMCSFHFEWLKMRWRAAWSDSYALTSRTVTARSG
jgi:ribosomal protein S26